MNASAGRWRWIALLAAVSSLPVEGGPDCSRGTNAPVRERPGAGPGATRMCHGSFALEDQFGKVQSLVLPMADPVVLLVADREGYSSLDPWISAVREEVSGTARVLGVADVRSVPAIFRGKVRRGFRKAQSRSVFLDWQGDLLQALRPVAGVPNCYLIGTNGVVRLHLHGELTADRIDELSKRCRREPEPTAQRVSLRTRS